MSDNYLHQRELVLIPFPFSNLREFKPRPVVVMSNDNYNRKYQDFIAIAITSNLKERDHVIRLTKKEMETGHLLKESVVKVDKIFSVDQSLTKIRIGRINKEAFNKIRAKLLDLI